MSKAEENSGMSYLDKSSELNDITAKMRELRSQFKTNKDGRKDFREKYFEHMKERFELRNQAQELLAARKDLMPFRDYKHPLQYSEWVITDWREYERGNVYVMMPDRSEIQGQNPPPTLRIQVFGTNGGAQINVSYGIEIVTPGAGIEIGLKTYLEGFVDNPPFEDYTAKVSGRLNAFVNLFRGVDQNLYEYPFPINWEWYNGWIEQWWAESWAPIFEPGISEDAGEEYSDSQEGAHVFPPISRELNVQICDLRAGDKLVMGYFFTVESWSSGIDFSYLNLGGLKFKTPVIRER